MNIEFGKTGTEIVHRLNRPCPLLAYQVAQRPRTQLFIAADPVAHAHEFAHQPAQKMRIAVVPVRNPRMREVRNGQLTAHAAVISVRTVCSYRARYSSAIRSAL